MKKYGLLCYFIYVFTFSLNGETQGDTLIIGYTQAAPFIIEEEGKLEGISIWLWEKIATNLNLAYEFREMRFGEMLQGLEQGEIDLSINPLTMTSERSKHMDKSLKKFWNIQREWNGNIFYRSINYRNCKLYIR